MIFVYVCSIWGIFELKTRLETWITRNHVNGVNLFNLSYVITIMAYVLTTVFKYPNQVFVFVWSIYRLFVLNRGWNRVSLQIMIIVYVCLTWGMVELKTCFETWITSKDLNGVSLFHLSNSITLMSYLCSQWTPNVQMKYIMFDSSTYRLFVLNTSLETWLSLNRDIHTC
jgi:hypothetical protein